MSAAEEGTPARPYVYTLELTPGVHGMETSDTDPACNDPRFVDVTAVEMPESGTTNPLVAEYLHEPVIFDFDEFKEGDVAYLTTLSFDENPREGKEVIAPAMLRIERHAGHIMARYVDMAGNTETDNHKQASLEEVAFLVEPKAVGIDASFGVCVVDESQPRAVRTGGYLLLDAFFPDIGHNDPRLRLGPVIDVVQYTSQELVTMFDDRP